MTAVQSERPPLYLPYVDPQAGNNVAIGRGLIVTEIAEACNSGNIDGLLEKVKKLIQQKAKVNIAVRECPGICGVGRFVTPLCLAVEKTNDFELITTLIKHGGIMHKLPSESAQVKIDAAFKKLWFEKYKLLREGQLSDNNDLGIIPQDVINVILEAGVQSGAPTLKANELVDVKSEDQATLEFWNYNAPPCCVLSLRKIVP